MFQSQVLDPVLLQWYQGLPDKQRVAFEETVVTKLRERQVIEELESYQFNPVGYVEKFLGWQPWSGAETGSIGQVELFEDYRLALHQQWERYEYEQGNLTLEQLTEYKPGQQIRNWVAVDAGHSVGKTKFLSGIVSHFHDTCRPSIVYAFAPLWDQINDLLFKEIRADREGSGLPGKVLAGRARVTYASNHFVAGRATVHGGSSKTERIQGQHGKYLMFVLDEAEGIPDYVWDAVESMASGGIAIVVVARNPRTTTCVAHKIRSYPYVQPRRISCMDHPNVVAGREIITGSVRRDYVEAQLKNCDVVTEHKPVDYTFELPWRPGTIYLPNQRFLWRVLGIASDQQSINTFCPRPMFEQAAARTAPVAYDYEELATFGVDAARYGDDMGTIYVKSKGRVYRLALLGKDDTYEYYIKIKYHLLDLIEEGITHVEIRVDAGGGFGGGVVDFINRDHELQSRAGTAFEAIESLQVIEVNFNSRAYESDKYGDKATEMYYHGGEAVHLIQVINAPESLMADVCERTYSYTKLQGYDVKVLEPKDAFRKRKSRSPDDGDGYVLAVSPSYIFDVAVDFWAV